MFRRPLCLFLVSYVLVILILHGIGTFHSVSSRDPVAWENIRVELTGVVTKHPDPRPKGTVFIVEGETIRPLIDGVRMARRTVHGKTLVQISNAKETFANPGDRLIVFGELKKPRGARIPGTFDYQRYLSLKKIHSVIYTSTRSVTNTGPTRKHQALKWGWKLQQHVVKTFRAYLTPEQATVLSGLVVGRRPRFHPEIRRIFIESGTMHILVASGSNVAFIVGLWFLLCRILLRFPRRWAFLSSLPLVWVYVLIVGMDPPIHRAGVMTTVAILAYLLAREDKAYHALTVAALSILIPDPRSLFDVGFQMSFLSVFGMVYFLPRVDPWFNTKSWKVMWSCRLIAATFTAQLWLVPITANVFRRFFPAGLLANIFIIPLAAGGLWVGLVLIIIDGLGFRSSILGLGIQLYVQFIINAVRFFADLPDQIFWIFPKPPHWIIGFYLVLLTVVHLKKSYVSRILFLIALILCLFPTSTPQGDKLKFNWLDTGRKLSLHIQTPTGKNFLINTGPLEPYDSTERILMPYFTENRIKKLEAVILTRSHPKYTAGLKTLKRSIKIESIYDKPVFEKFGDLTIEPLKTSTTFKTEPALLLTYKDKHFVLADVLSLATQYDLLDRNLKTIEILQARFSNKYIWKESFVKQIKPTLLVETGFGTPYHPSTPPWSQIPTEIPQKLGYFSKSFIENISYN